jgi:hypothetical protein
MQEVFPLEVVVQTLVISGGSEPPPPPVSKRICCGEIAIKTENNSEESISTPLVRENIFLKFAHSQ